MIWNTLLLALREIRRNLLRSFLTILGIVIGVAAVITMVTLGNGATKSISGPGIQPRQQPADGASGPAHRAVAVPAHRCSRSPTCRQSPRRSRCEGGRAGDAQAASVVVGSRNWSTIATGGTRDYFTAAG